MNKEYKCVVVGAGWAGIAAAVQASKQNIDTLLIERTDMLLGTGLSGGIMRNNGRFTATEEAIEMGASELFHICDSNSIHKNICFPGHEHASLYDVSCVLTDLLELLKHMGIEVMLNTRIKDIEKKDGCITSVITENGEYISGEAFIDATGTAGPMQNCRKYGNGCVMCIYRCPTFGSRISLSEKFGISEILNMKQSGKIGAMSGSSKILKSSLSDDIVNELNKEGVVVIPLPSNLKKVNLDNKVCQQYALDEYKENIVLLDIGAYAKMMASFYPLDEIRTVSGMENSVYVCPLAGGIGNSIRFVTRSPVDKTMKVKGVDNLFCCGERAGLFVGHTEAIITGTLAGYNAGNMINHNDLFTFPHSCVIGDAISFAIDGCNGEDGLWRQYTFSGSIYFDRMIETGLYSTHINSIKDNINRINLGGVFS